MKTSHELKDWITGVVDSKLYLDSDFLRSNQWTVVPVESGSHFDDSDISRIVLAVRSTGNKELNAFLIEDASDVDSHLQFKSDIIGFQHFNLKCGHFNYAICPDDCSFLIVCTTSDYYLVAGKQEFVESVLGKSIIESRKEFDEFAKDDEWPEPEKSLFREVAALYNP